ncbi:hypothetical protein HK103_001317 [Boothiomyces macroporosus]|uniref:Uncharacterized protein n=1 Tax=Boothiomyces macroporosus TaxID=261099 RepID=A0AAD5Y546_9FUNG|nr:hypothetical protein HK103_001317 [Boothiomyces macroporosus]
MRIYYFIQLAQALNDPSHPVFSFYVSAVGYQPYAIIDVLNTNQVQFTWSWDTCAGQVDGSGNRVVGATVGSDGKCQYNGVDTHSPSSNNAVFSSGFTTLSLTAGFTGSTQINLLPSVASNNGDFIALTHSLTLTNLQQYPSGYYTLQLAAQDSDGNPVKGQSPIYAFKNKDPLPPVQKINLYSPLGGSYWLANAEYRIRFEIAPGGYQPDHFHVDLLTPAGQLITRILENAQPLANDDLLGSNHMLNYTLWNITSDLANRQFRLKITGVQDIGGKVVTLPDPPTTTSGIFFIGPVKP